MPNITEGWLRELLDEHQSPCVSVYLPVHRARPPADEDAVRFASALNLVHEGLVARWPHGVVGQVMDKLRSAEEWVVNKGGDRDGLGIFTSPDYFRVIELQGSLDQAATVADSFHVKPLIRMLQSAARYQVLCLSQKQVEIYEGTQFRVDRLPLHAVPPNAGIVSGMRLSTQISSVTDLAEAPRQVSESGVPESPASLDRFFRAVDKAVWENYSRSSRLPLILVAVERYHPTFHALSINSFLLEEGIKLDPHRLPPERLREQAWAILQRRNQDQLARLRDQFGTAKARHRGSDQLANVARAATDGRVSTLLLESERRIPGHLDRQTGRIRPATQDVLDELAEVVLKRDGQVVLVPHEQMPTDAAVAAIYRY